MAEKEAIVAQILCVNKQDGKSTHERIINVGGINPDGGRWKLSQAAAITGIENGTYKFYSSVNGQSVWVIISTSATGRKYLKTQNDGVDENNLLNLPECP